MMIFNHLLTYVGFLAVFTNAAAIHNEARDIIDLQQRQNTNAMQLTIDPSNQFCYGVSRFVIINQRYLGLAINGAVAQAAANVFNTAQYTYGNWIVTIAFDSLVPTASLAAFNPAFLKQILRTWAATFNANPNSAEGAWTEHSILSIASPFSNIVGITYTLWLQNTDTGILYRRFAELDQIERKRDLEKRTFTGSCSVMYDPYMSRNAASADDGYVCVLSLFPSTTCNDCCTGCIPNRMVCCPLAGC